MAAAKLDPRVDELRQQLRALGYLDAGVDRFVLGAAREARTPSAIAWLAGVRIGVLTAVLVGPASAIGVSARIPGLITGARDAFVVAAYMGLIFGAAVCVAASLAGVMVAWYARRKREPGTIAPRRAAVAAGAILTIACLGYLTLWWDVSAFRRLPLTWTLVGLAFAAGVSLLIGHLVTVASLAVSVAATGTGGQAHGVPGTSRRVIASAAVMAFCGAVLLFTVTDRARGGESEPPPLTVVSSGIRVRLIAIDGFDPEIGRRLAGAGRIPYLAAVLKLGTPSPVGVSAGPTRTARATVAVDDTRDPARAWTTIATGQPPDVHAVRGLETRRVAGVQGALIAAEPSTAGRALAAVTDLVRLTRPAVASGDERRVKTRWEVAAAGGLRTVVVNWWATWPAPADSGVVFTDRALLRLEHGGELDAEIAPPLLYEPLRARWPAIREAATARAATIQRAGQIGDLLRRSAEIDATHISFAFEGADAASADLICVYLSGLDVVQHALLATSDGAALSPSAMAERLDALEEYYLFLDRLIAGTIGEASPNSGWLNVHLTTPGRVQTRTPGLLALSGEAVNARAEDALAGPTDVMPTLLHALGVPISRELAGRPLVELFAADFARRYPVRSIATYGAPLPKQAPRGRAPLDQEMIDRLRSLGYVR